MFKPVPDSSVDLATALLTHYSFDLGGYSASQLIKRWESAYPIEWIHIAVIEALYQGRYKAVSVQQILNFWQRRGQATYHFNMEFERLICSKFPESLTSLHTPVLSPAKKSTTLEKTHSHLIKANPSPNQVENAYHQRKIAPLPPLVSKEQKQLSSHNTQRISESPTPSVVASTPMPQLSSNVPSNLDLQERLEPNTPVAPSPKKAAHFLPPATNHSPIGQFTPETSDRTESFTSKLKAMSSRQVPAKTYTQERLTGENSATN
ncbi:MAG: hypothetical protein KME32_26375 [Mojavia pulchra JT2-VF2]|uniref:DnaD domain-containing protein n=1 Tax=Mojavia pulchra JT2-VF2 TaxID=287848 RepID=A0A951Q4T2_9NOST|nr:hypothetical protein [Mojavia pulchra JT2-VF2]